MDQINVSAANSKGWAVSNKHVIARYKFDSSMYDLFPTFNEGFTYTFEDEYIDTEDIIINNEPSLFNIDDIDTDEELNEDVKVFLAENICTRTIYSEELPTSIKFGYSSKPAENDVLSLLVSEYTKITNKVKNLTDLFAQCQNLISVNTSCFDFSNVQSITTAFYNCKSLETIDVSNWDTGNVLYMNHTFFTCEK